jgi:DNA polymerase III, delta'' subunit
MFQFLPWHLGHWKWLALRIATGSVPQALLLSGPRGLGRHTFAHHLGQALLCQECRPTGFACGVCRNCRLFSAGSHPDWHTVTLEEEGKSIYVDQIRALCASLALTSQYGGYKLALITPAERMTLAAANSLLKTLEEPAAQTVVLLVAEHGELLPATVRSRCQKVMFTHPPRETALPWLAERVKDGNTGLLLDLAGGAPLAALALAEEARLGERVILLKGLQDVIAGRADPLTVASDWCTHPLRDCLFWLSSWIVDMIRLKVCEVPPRVNNPDLRDHLLGIAEHFTARQLYGHLDHLVAAVRLLDTSINKQLLIEDLMISWRSPGRAAV